MRISVWSSDVCSYDLRVGLFDPIFRAMETLMTSLSDLKIHVALGQRQVVIDSETTGFACEDGDRMVELAAVEVVDLIPTGKTLHMYFNPDRKSTRLNSSH